jgi:hypothetical protein
MASPLALPFRQLSCGNGSETAFTNIADIAFDNDNNVLVLGHHCGQEKLMRVSRVTGILSYHQSLLCWNDGFLKYKSFNRSW